MKPPRWPALAGFLCLLLLSPGIFAAPAGKPNVLFLFTDDQRADTIAALGNPHIRTPNLDTIARRGFVFRNAYCLGADIGAVCTPSRNMLLSGRAYFRWAGERLASGNPPNFPLSMKDAGYITYHHGKKGNTALNIQAKFDINKYTQNDQAERQSGEPGREIADQAIEFVKGGHEGKPFFMYLAFGNPHDPRVAAKKYLDMYQRDQIPLPKNYRPVHPFDNGEMTVRDELLAPWPRTEEVVRQHLHEYYATITALDGHIGRLLDALKATGEFDNTIIVVSSDHGLAIGSQGLFGKQNLYEDGMKVPFIFAGPGIPKGESPALAYLMDIYPTTCQLVGAPVPGGLDGKSLAPIIHGQSSKVRDTLFLSYRHVQRAIRDDRWKLIRYPQINRTQLFDLQSDPHEIRDLAGNQAYAGQISKLLAVMEEWQQEFGDLQPLTADQPQPWEFYPPTAAELEAMKKPARKAKASK